MDKLKNIKIAFIDIDGTLSNSKKEVTIETSNSIENSSKYGIKTVLCSGRGNNYVCNYSKKANASNYIIACNGAEVFDYQNNNYIFQSKIEFNEIKKIWDFCLENNICCLLNSQKYRYCNKNLFIPEEDKILIDDINSIKSIPIYQIVTIAKEYDYIKYLDLFISNNTQLNIVNTSFNYINKINDKHHYFLDIVNKGVNKGTAIKALLNNLNLKKENSIGFGDHINDFDLFNNVGFKIAMDNACDNLKDKANYITLSNDDNGVAFFLDNYIDYNTNKIKINKDDILQLLKKYNFDPKEYIIISGAALVLQGIKEYTTDIDIAVSSKLYNKLLKDYNCVFERTTENYDCYFMDDIINFSEHYYNDIESTELFGYKIQTIDSIHKLKENLNRENDKQDIKLIIDFYKS